MNLTAVPFAVAAGGSVACAVLAIFPPPRNLTDRVRPYTLVARSRMGDTSAEVAELLAAPRAPGSAISRIFGPILRSLVDRFSALVGQGNETATALALDRAGIRGVTPRQFATQQLLASVAGLVIGAAGGAVLNVRIAVLFAVAGTFIGWRHKWSDLSARTKDRTMRMRAELRTVANVIAVHARANPNIQSVIAEVCRRGRGEVVHELRGILDAIAAGTPAADAFARARERTAEPAAGRLYDTLDQAVTSGGDISDALRAQVRDIRQLTRDDTTRRGHRQKIKMVGASSLLMPLPLFVLVFPLLPYLVLSSK